MNLRNNKNFNFEINCLLKLLNNFLKNFQNDCFYFSKNNDELFEN